MESSNLPILIFAGLLGAWFGAALFYVVIVGPAAVQAGSSGVGFLQMLAQRYGTGPFYAVLAFLTVITGIWMYLANGVYVSASGSNVWATLAGCGNYTPINVVSGFGVVHELGVCRRCLFGQPAVIQAAAPINLGNLMRS